MPRCRKILRNGNRCKAHAISGSKYCLFHTTGKGMRRVRTKKKVRTEPSESLVSRKGRQTLKNQVAVRGSRKAGTAIAAYGAYLQTKPYSTTYVKDHPARINRQGTVYVGAHQQRTHIPTPSRDGKGFLRTEKRRHRGIAMGRFMVWGGRLVPVLGYGYAGHSIVRGTAHYESGPLESNRLHDAIGPLALPVSVLAETGYTLLGVGMLGSQMSASASTTSGMSYGMGGGGIY